MKKILLLLTLITFSAFAQNPDYHRYGVRTPFTKYISYTTSQRDALTPSSTDRTIIHHKNDGTSINRLEQWDGDSWEELGGSSLDADLLRGVHWGNVNTNIITSGTATAAPATLSTELVTKGQLDAAVRPYLVYTALLSQSGTGDPTATVLENTLGGTVVWSRSSDGVYQATLSGAFTTNKTFCFFQKSTQTTSSSPFTYSFSAPVSGSNVVDLETQLAGANTDSLIERCSIEIRVYP